MIKIIKTMDTKWNLSVNVANSWNIENLNKILKNKMNLP